MRPVIFLGIDPGKSGALAMIHMTEGNPPAVDTVQFSNITESEIFDAFALGLCEGGTFGLIERVSAMPRQGVSSTFKFGMSYGFLRACLVGNSIPFEEVTPQTWQRAMGCLSGGDKNITKQKAQQLFPQLKVTHATADALLIAEYCRRTHGK